MVDRKKVGKRSRTKGKVFERAVAKLLRERFPHKWWADKIRRSDQGHGASLSDVTGVPGVWLECETGAATCPPKKHQQALRDIAKAKMEGQALPVVVQRKKGSPRIHAHLTIADLVGMLDACGLIDHLNHDEFGGTLVRIDLVPFFDLLDEFDTTRPPEDDE